MCCYVSFHCECFTKIYRIGIPKCWMGAPLPCWFFLSQAHGSLPRCLQGGMLRSVPPKWPLSSHLSQLRGGERRQTQPNDYGNPQGRSVVNQGEGASPVQGYQAARASSLSSSAERQQDWESPAQCHLAACASSLPSLKAGRGGVTGVAVGPIVAALG